MVTKSTTHKQTNERPIFFFETEQLPFEKKTGPGQIQTMDICRPRRIRYTRLNAQETTKVEFIMCHGTTSLMAPVDIVVYWKNKSSTRLQFPCYR